MDKSIKIFINNINVATVPLESDMYLIQLIERVLTTVKLELNLTDETIKSLYESSALYNNIAFLFLGPKLRYLYTVSLGYLNGCKNVKLKDAISRQLFIFNKNQTIQDIQYENVSSIYITTSIADWNKFLLFESIHADVLINHNTFFQTKDESLRVKNNNLRRRLLHLIQEYVKQENVLPNLSKNEEQGEWNDIPISYDISKMAMLSLLTNPANCTKITNTENELNYDDLNITYLESQAGVEDNDLLTNDMIVAIALHQEMNGLDCQESQEAIRLLAERGINISNQHY